MQVDPAQMVFPFVEDDPLYRREIREKKIVSEVKAALEPVLRERMTGIISKMAEPALKEKLNAMVAEAVTHSVENIQAMFSDIRFLLQELLLRCAECRDPADWWKRGPEQDEDEDIPF